MNDKAQEILAGLIQRATDGLDAAVEFSQAQIPDVIAQLLTWHFVYAVVLTGIFVLMTVGGATLGLIALKQYRRGPMENDRDNKGRFKTDLVWDRDGDIHPGTLLVGAGTIGPIIIGVVNGLSHGLDALKIGIAPKLYLLEYGAGLLK